MGGLPCGISEDLPHGTREMGIFDRVMDIPQGEGYSCLLTQTLTRRSNWDATTVLTLPGLVERFN